METQTREIKATVRVEDVVLTYDAIGTLKAYQEEDGNTLKHKTDILSDVICYLSMAVYEGSPYVKKDQISIWLLNLSYIREELKSFAKPE